MSVGHSLRHLALALGQLACAPPTELEHSVHPVHHQAAEPEKRGGPQGSTVAGLQECVSFHIAWH